MTSVGNVPRTLVQRIAASRDTFGTQKSNSNDRVIDPFDAVSVNGKKSVNRAHVHALAGGFGNGNYDDNDDDDSRKKVSSFQPNGSLRRKSLFLIASVLVFAFLLWHFDGFWEISEYLNGGDGSGGGGDGGGGAFGRGWRLEASHGLFTTLDGSASLCDSLSQRTPDVQELHAVAEFGNENGVISGAPSGVRGGAAAGNGAAAASARFNTLRKTKCLCADSGSSTRGNNNRKDYERERSLVEQKYNAAHFQQPLSLHAVCGGVYASSQRAAGKSATRALFGGLFSSQPSVKPNTLALDRVTRCPSIQSWTRSPNTCSLQEAACNPSFTEFISWQLPSVGPLLRSPLWPILVNSSKLFIRNPCREGGEQTTAAASAHSGEPWRQYLHEKLSAHRLPPLLARDIERFFDKQLDFYFSFHYEDAIVFDEARIESSKRRLTANEAAPSAARGARQKRDDVDQAKERREIIDHFLSFGRRNNSDTVHSSAHQNSVFFIGGGGGAGKSTLLKHLWAKTNFIPSPGPRAGVVYINHDLIMERLPEYQRLVAAGDWNAANRMHSVAATLGETIFAAALREHFTVVYEGTMAEPEIALRKFRLANVLGYRSVLIASTVQADIALRRAQRRALLTGRFVPSNILLQHHKLFSEHFKSFLPFLDEVYLYETISSKGTLIATKTSAPLSSLPLIHSSAAQAKRGSGGGGTRKRIENSSPSASASNAYTGKARLVVLDKKAFGLFLRKRFLNPNARNILELYANTSDAVAHGLDIDGARHSTRCAPTLNIRRSLRGAASDEQLNSALDTNDALLDEASDVQNDSAGGAHSHSKHYNYNDDNIVFQSYARIVAHGLRLVDSVDLNACCVCWE